MIRRLHVCNYFQVYNHRNNFSTLGSELDGQAVTGWLGPEPQRVWESR